MSGGYSPFEIMYERSPRLPSDHQCSRQQVSKDDYRPVELLDAEESRCLRFDAQKRGLLSTPLTTVDKVLVGRGDTFSMLKEVTI